MTKNTFKPILGMRDLEQFGITPLTGESCAFSLRILCDVNEAGRALLADYFGIPDLELPKNWNSTVNNAPAVGSILLPRQITRELAQYALFAEGALGIAVTADGCVTGIFEKEYLERYDAISEKSGISVFRNYRQPAEGTRHRHEMSGRVN